MRADLVGGGWRENSQSSISEKGKSRSGSAQWKRGHWWPRESQVGSFAVDIPGGPQEVAALELGLQERLSPGGRT